MTSPALKDHPRFLSDPVGPEGSIRGLAKALPWQSAWRATLAAGGAGSGPPTTCATCHDSHGSAKSPSLLAFDKTIVTR